MLYENLDSLMATFIQIDVDDMRSLKALGALCRVYNNALSNPPDGVIGVGAITYAQQALVDFQMNHPEYVDEIADALQAWESEQARRAAEDRLAYHVENDTLDLY